MNEKDIKLWQFGSFVFTSLIGTLLHFLYEWSGENKIAALFSGVNESTWEHMKLMFVPIFAFALIQRGFFKDFESFFCIKLIGLLTSLILIPILFYTYNGSIAQSPDFVNIAIFFISAAVGYLIETKLFLKNDFKGLNGIVCLIIMFFIGVLFAVFTFYPPNLNIFKEPK